MYLQEDRIFEKIYRCSEIITSVSNSESLTRLRMALICNCDGNSSDLCVCESLTFIYD